MKVVSVGSSFSAKRVGGLLALLLLANFFHILSGSETLCYRDFGVMAIPTAWHHRSALLNGELPLWNPLSNCGVPFLAQWGTMVLYPPTLLYVLLPMPWSLNLFCVLHLWIGGLGMYYLARKWVSAEWPAAVAAVAFALSGIMQAALTWPNYTAALGLLPWVVLAVERSWDEEHAQRIASRRAIFLAAATTAMQLLTGVPELCVFTWLFLTILWIERLLRDRSRWKQILFRHCLVVIGATALCAAQLLPFLQLLTLSQRTPGFAAEKWALPAWGWANLILPRFHTFTTPSGTNYQYGQEFLSSTYIGLPILLLAFVEIM